MNKSQHVYYSECFDRYQGLSQLEDLREKLQDTQHTKEELECIRKTWTHVLIINLLGKKLSFVNMEKRPKHY